jgi:hypothetical protein
MTITTATRQPNNTGETPAEYRAASAGLTRTDEPTGESITMTPEQTALLAEESRDFQERAQRLWAGINRTERFTEYAQRLGSYFFSPDTMRGFGSRILEAQGVRYDGNMYYMCMSDRYWDGRRVYSIVTMDAGGNVSKLKGYDNDYSKSRILTQFKKIGQAV